jgi:hypothetical protein
MAVAAVNITMGVVYMLGAPQQALRWCSAGTPSSTSWLWALCTSLLTSGARLSHITCSLRAMCILQAWLESCRLPNDEADRHYEHPHRMIVLSELCARMLALESLGQCLTEGYKSCCKSTDKHIVHIIMPMGMMLTRSSVHLQID